MSSDPTLPLPVSASWSPRQVIQATLMVLLVLLGFGALVVFHLAIFSLLIAIVIDTAINPAVDALYRRGVPRAAGVGLVYLGAGALLVTLGWMSAPLLAEQALNISERSSTYYLSLRSQLLGSSNGLLQRLALELPRTFSLDAGTETAGEAMDAIVRALGYIGGLGRALFMTVAVFLLAFFWTLEQERVLRAVLWTVPGTHRSDVQDLIAQAQVKIGAYIRGLAILCLLVGTLTVIAYSAIGLPYALLLGILAGLFEALPIIGPVLGAIPAIVVALSFDPTRAIWVIAITGVIQVAENTLLVPRVMSRAVGVNPVAVLLALAAFSSVLGLPGALLAIPVVAIIQLLVDRYVLDPRLLESQIPEGRDPLSVVRYETNEFVQDMRKQIRNKSSGPDQTSDQVEEALEIIAQDLNTLLAEASLKKREP